MSLKINEQNKSVSHFRQIEAFRSIQKDDLTSALNKLLNAKANADLKVSKYII